MTTWRRWRTMAGVSVLVVVLATGCGAVAELVGADPGEELPANADPFGAGGAPDQTVRDEPDPDLDAPTAERDGSDDAATEQDGARIEPVEAPCTADDTMLEPEPPPIAERVEEATGDLTGDGHPDRIITYAIVAGEHVNFFLRFVAASGYVVEVPLDDVREITPLRPLGAAAIGSAREVAFVLEGSGAAAAGVSLWALHDLEGQPCALMRVTIPDHTISPLFPVGGTVGSASGLACDDIDGSGTDELVVRSLTPSEDDPDGWYDWSEQAWSWPGAGELQFVGEDSGRASVDELDGFGLDCPGVAEP